MRVPERDAAARNTGGTPYLFGGIGCHHALRERTLLDARKSGQDCPPGDVPRICQAACTLAEWDDLPL